MRTVYLVELDAVIDEIGTVTTLRYASEGFANGRADALADVAWLPYLADPGQVEQYLWDARSTGGLSRIGFGDLRLVNVGGDLDYLAAYQFSGQRFALRSVEAGQPFAASTLVLEGLMDNVELDTGFVTVRLRDRQADLQQPVAALVFSAGSDGGIPPLARERVLADIDEVDLVGTSLAVTLTAKPVVGRHLVLQAVLRGPFRIDGSVSFPAVSDNQGGVWRYQMSLLDDVMVVITAVCRNVVDPTPASPCVVTIQLPGTGGAVYGSIQELSGALSSSLWRARAPSGRLYPVPVSVQMVTNALPVTGDYALTTLAVKGPSGDAGIVQVGGWIAEFTQNNLALNVGAAGASRAVDQDGAVEAIWYCVNSAGFSAAADLVVLACGTD